MAWLFIDAWSLQIYLSLYLYVKEMALQFF